MTLEYRSQPEPPQDLVDCCHHHWLAIYDHDNHYFGLIVLEWSPTEQKWYRSNEAGTGTPVDALYYQYVGPVPTPSFP